MPEPRSNFKIFVASFLTLIAAGAAFGMRAKVLGDWETQFGFTKTELGEITGAGLTGFGITIILGSLIVDRLGYKTILIGAFLMHMLSAVITLSATPIAAAVGGGGTDPESIKKAHDAAYLCLIVGMYALSLGTGLCETVINPLVATLYPKQKTHYLNILHAAWPGGLILGALLAYLFVGSDAVFQSTNADGSHTPFRWEIPMSFYLVAVLAYGLITIVEKFPVSETRAAGVKFSEMLWQFTSPILLMLLVLHAMVGYVELGTDSWITNVLDNVIRNKGLLVFIYTSGLMFVLRFFAGPIVERINPLGLLFISACVATVGLYMLGTNQTVAMVFVAATVYGLGKTFFWPTMLGVAGERFPKGGALVMGTMGGIGMLSAGLLGGPIIGYKQDYFASQKLEQDPAIYELYKADKANQPLPFLKPVTGLNGQKVGELKKKVDKIDILKEEGKPIPAADQLTPEQERDAGPVLAANLYGGQEALKYTATVPAMMAVGYLILVIYFRMTGGYKAIHIHGEPEGPAEY